MAKKKPEIAELENRFAFHPATPTTGPKHDGVRSTLLRVAKQFQRDLPDGRHKAMALTKLQEAMWAANAAIACDSPVESSAAPAEPRKRMATRAKKTATRRPRRSEPPI